MTLAGDRLAVGGLWRDVLNVIEDAPVMPDHYLPIARSVLPRWASWSYFLGRAAESVARPDADVLADLERARLGWRIWSDRRDALRSLVETSIGVSPSDADLRAWWVEGARGESATWDERPRGGRDDDEGGHRETVVRILGLSAADIDVLRHHPDIPGGPIERWSLRSLHRDLGWTSDLETLRGLAARTWPADVRDREPWTQDDLEFVTSWYDEQQPLLLTAERQAPYDPFAIEVVHDEQSLGFGLDGLSYVMLVLLRSTVIDFMDSVLELSRRADARGSMACIACGQWVGRRALGYGQLYCSDTCKRRVAQRRRRARQREMAGQPASA